MPCPVSQGGEYPPRYSRPKMMKTLLVQHLLVHQLMAMRGRMVKRTLPHPHAYLKPPLPPPHTLGPPSGPDVGPLDLSVRKPKSQTPIPAPKPPQEKERVWKPLVRSRSWNPRPRDKLEWFPVTRKVTQEKKPTFYPLKPGSRKFPWVNPLNRIFLQEKPSPHGEDTEGKSQRSSPPAVTQDRKLSESSHPVHPSPKEAGAPLAPALKPLKSNPFKITPSNNWPIDTPEHPSKPILAPPRFEFGRPPSSGSGNPFSPMPSSAVSVANESSKTTFKLKPSVLGSSVPSTPTPTPPAPKRPAPDAQPDEEVNSRVSGSTFESSSDAKRVRVSEDAAAPPASSRPSCPDRPPQQVSPSPTASHSPSLSKSPKSPRGERQDPPSQSSASAGPVPTFVPLTTGPQEGSSSEDSPSRVNGVGATSPTLSSKVDTGFIFGQNLQNRVSGVSSTSSTMVFSNGETRSSSPSTGLNLFTAAANSLSPSSATADGGKSLSETSREFSLKEESLKTKYEEVQIVTGEEGEKNVIQMNCKLYGWSNGSWQERGRGILRLNDREIRDELHSRLVIRTQGTLTVMLNAKIWAEMSIEKPNDKSVRFTASDSDGQPKIYLVMGSPKDVTLLHNSLEYRVAAARSQTLDEKEREADQENDSLLSLPV